jgi:hypothetical protein
MLISVTDERSLETLTAKDFRDHRGTRLRLTAGSPEGGQSVSVEAKLAEVSEYTEGARGTFRAPFSVLFHGPVQPVLPQGIYRLEGERFGDCSAGGSYDGGSGHFQAFVVSQAGGTWGKAKEVPGTVTLNTAGDAQISSAPAGTTPTAPATSRRS